jgi:hypothetical protein
MRNLLKHLCPSMLVIATAAFLSRVAMMTSAAPSAPAAASENVSHIQGCAICQLPLHSRKHEPSKLGPEPGTTKEFEGGLAPLLEVIPEAAQCCGDGRL